MELIQGNTYSIGLTVTDKDNNIVRPDDVETIEFCLGKNVRKTFGMGGEVEFDDGKYILMLAQEDTFRLEGNVRLQIRVKFKDERGVKGTSEIIFGVKKSISKEIL